jgi:hypothetical protein
MNHCTIASFSNDGGQIFGRRLVLTMVALAASQAVWSQQSPIPGNSIDKPGVGDKWVYEAVDTDHPRRNFQYVVQLREVETSSITDVSQFGPNAQVAQVHQAGAHLMSLAPGIADFSPYLFVFQAINGAENWDEIKFDRLWGCGRVEFIVCRATGRVVAREKVTVRAGTFDAWKIVVKLRLWMGASATGSGELTYWLAEQARRTVKFQSRVNFQVGGHYSWPEPNMDVELVSYTRGNTR